MNKAILMGRLTRDPEMRYSQSATPVAVCRFSLAVNRRFKRDSEPDADFINCVAFGKTGEFIEKYFKKGMMLSLTGRIQVSSYDDKQGQKRWSTDVIVEEAYFTESKASADSARSVSASAPKPTDENEGFYPIDSNIEDDDLPF